VTQLVIGNVAAGDVTVDDPLIASVAEFDNNVVDHLG
jgi:hypothetical protein